MSKEGAEGWPSPIVHKTNEAWSWAPDGVEVVNDRRLSAMRSFTDYGSEILLLQCQYEAKCAGNGRSVGCTFSLR